MTLEQECETWTRDNDVFRMLDSGRGRLNELLTAFVRQKMAEAWEEGRNAKHRVAWEAGTSSKPIIEPVNPYGDKP